MALARTREALHNGWDKNDPRDAQVILHMLRIGATQRYHDPLMAGINDVQELSNMTRPNMRFVPVKSADQQAVLMLRRMLARLIPTQERRSMPWDAIPWRPRVHIGLFVHRVDGLAPGIYALARDPDKVEILKRAMRSEFCWQRVPTCPTGLPLYLLQEGNCRALATTVSCGQDIAGDGAFSLAMIADYMDSLATYGARFYRNLFWEAGMVGQIMQRVVDEISLLAAARMHGNRLVAADDLNPVDIALRQNFLMAGSAPAPNNRYSCSATLVNAINRAPIDERQSEAIYEIHVVTGAETVGEVRGLWPKSGRVL